MGKKDAFAKKEQEKRWRSLLDEIETKAKQDKEALRQKIERERQQNGFISDAMAKLENAMRTVRDQGFIAGKIAENQNDPIIIQQRAMFSKRLADAGIANAADQDLIYQWFVKRFDSAKK